MTPPGDYEVQGDGADRTVTGDCAKCTLAVKPGDPHRILYSTLGTRGGIFHAGCAPTGDDWYPVDVEAPDV